MNKAISTNIGGIFFHIDEIAYQKLRHYLNAVRSSLKGESYEIDEILKDIEQRISELLSDKLMNDRTVIDEGNINEVIEIMGKPEDYSEEEASQEQNTTSIKRKLFRDSDNRILGGVCSGLANYVGMDLIWMRILWVLLFVFYGFGFIVYILLWIIIPKAVTSIEKLQMKGEATTIDNIEKKIREELNHVSSKVKSGVSHAADTIGSKEFKEKTKNGIEKVIEALSQLLRTLFGFFRKIIGFFIVLFSSLSIVFLVLCALSLIGLHIGGVDDFMRIPYMFYQTIIPFWIFCILAFLALVIPVFALFILGLRILFTNIKPLSSVIRYSLLGVWIISSVFMIISIATIVNKMTSGTSVTSTELPIKNNDTLTVKMVGSHLINPERKLRQSRSNKEIIVEGKSTLYSTNIDIDVEQTDEPNASIVIRKKSTGLGRLKATERAEEIEYRYKLNSKRLELDGYFLSSMEYLHDNQNITITLYLPTGSTLYFDSSTRTYLEHITNSEDVDSHDIPRNYFKMGEDELMCLDCDSRIINKKSRKGHFNLDIDEDRINLSVGDGTNKSTIKIDSNGIDIENDTLNKN